MSCLWSVLAGWKPTLTSTIFTERTNIQIIIIIIITIIIHDCISNCSPSFNTLICGAAEAPNTGLVAVACLEVKQIDGGESPTGKAMFFFRNDPAWQEHAGAGGIRKSAESDKNVDINLLSVFVTVCVFLYMLHTEYQNLHSLSKVKISWSEEGREDILAAFHFPGQFEDWELVLKLGLGVQVRVGGWVGIVRERDWRIHYATGSLRKDRSTMMHVC